MLNDLPANIDTLDNLDISCLDPMLKDYVFSSFFIARLVKKTMDENAKLKLENATLKATLHECDEMRKKFDELKAIVASFGDLGPAGTYTAEFAPEEPGPELDLSSMGFMEKNKDVMRAASEKDSPEIIIKKGDSEVHIPEPVIDTPIDFTADVAEPEPVMGTPVDFTAEATMPEPEPVIDTPVDFTAEAIEPEPVMDVPVDEPADADTASLLSSMEDAMSALGIDESELAAMDLEAPAPEPVPEPVVEAPVPEPVMEVPADEPADADTASLLSSMEDAMSALGIDESELAAMDLEAPAPEPVPEPVVEAPAPEPVPEPVAEAPAPEPKPEVIKPFTNPPVAKPAAPTPKPEPKPAAPAPKPEPKPAAPAVEIPSDPNAALTPEQIAALFASVN